MIASWWRRLAGNARLERELDAELREHLERRIADYRAAGLPEAEARRQARLELGGLEQTKEECRDVRGTRLVRDLARDVHYAIRTLLKAPGFTLAALLLLALGIGANTAIFSLFEAVMLRRLPVAAPEDLYFVAHRTRGTIRIASNYSYFERVRGRTDVFADATAFTTTDVKVRAGEAVERVGGQYVASNYHAVVGVGFALGRGFAPEHDRDPGASSVAVISDAYWARRFGRSADVLQHSIVVGDRTLAIIGVTARGFDGLTPGQPADITLPLALKLLENPEFLTMKDTWTSMPIVARLKPGVSAAEASGTVAGVFRQFLSEPDNTWYKAEGAMLVPAGSGTGELRTRYGAPLRVLIAIVAIVLLIASANLASLQLARAAARTKEVAVRLSIGASRGRLMRQFLTESLVLAGAGGALGLAVAVWGSGLLAWQFRDGRNPVVLDITPNALAIAFTATASILTGVLFGVLPAIAATRLDPVSALKEARPRGRARFWGSGRQSLVALQIGLCLALVTGAGLLAQTLRNLRAADRSVEGAFVHLFPLEENGPAFPNERLPGFCAELLERVTARPDVESASCSTSSPVDMNENRRGAVARGAGIGDGVLANVVTPGFFPTFGVSLVAGRSLTAEDTPSAARVAVVNERMASTAFAGVEPIGHTFHFRSEPKRPLTIVGVVRDVRHNLREAAPPTVYTPLGQGGEIEGSLTLAVRSRANAEAVSELVRSEVQAKSRDALVGRGLTLDQQIGGELARERALALVSGWFGVLAVALACVGLYGLMSFEVVRGRREIGIRLALGANPGAVLRQVLGRTVTLSLVGIGLGLALSLAATRVLSGLLFGVSATDPTVLALAAALLAGTTIAAGLLPARRAARVDPTLALRVE